MTGTHLTDGGFDYGAYDAEVMDELREAAIHIRARGHEHASALIEIGTTLSRVKDKVGHGRWGSWLLIEFSMSVSTAERYMRVAKWAADKIVTVTNLQPSTLYVLSAKSTPAALGQEVLDQVKANKPISEKDLRHQLASKRKKKRAAEEEERHGVTEGITMPAHCQDGAPPPREEEPQPQAFEGQKLEREAANAAVLMLRDSLGDDFRYFVKLWEDAGGAFPAALRNLAAVPGEVVEAAEADPTPDPAPSPPIVGTEQRPTAPPRSITQPDQAPGDEDTAERPVEADQQPTVEPKPLSESPPDVPVAEPETDSSPGTVANLLEKRGGGAPTPPGAVACHPPRGEFRYGS
jgi:hypothetical protein